MPRNRSTGRRNDPDAAAPGYVRYVRAGLGETAARPEATRRRFRELAIAASLLRPPGDPRKVSDA